MAKITVKVRGDRGELGTHPKYGALTGGAEITVDEEAFGAELFERPTPDWLSPHEAKDAARAAEIRARVGQQEPPAGAKASAGKPEKSQTKEVTDHA